MFLRRTQVTSRGRRYDYVHLVESFRRKSDGRPTHRIIANLGALDELSFENLKAALDASRRRKHVAVVSTPRAGRNALSPEANLRYLDVAVAVELWRQWGLTEVFEEIVPPGDREVPFSQLVEILVVHRLLAPNSKLAAARWFPRTALPELLGIEARRINNTRIHRALDELNAATPTLMAKLPRLYRERDGAFVSLFMDVTDAWFVGHGPELAVRAKTKEGLVERKIGIVLLCNKRGYPLRWQVISGRCSESVAMSDMLQEISGLNWVGEAPVVVDRAMGKSAYLSFMAATRLRFLTALTRPEFSKYAPALPWTATGGFALTECEASDLAVETARRVMAAGMHKVDDKLFVLDFGVLAPMSGGELELNSAEIDATPSSDDPAARALRLARQVEQAVTDGRHNSYAAAAAGIGLSNGLCKKYRQLLRLPDDLQRLILEGKAAACSLAGLIRIARLDRAQIQRAEFQALIESTPAPRVPLATHSPKPDTSAAHDVHSQGLRVRVVGYFNPVRFAEQRRAAHERLKRIETFVAQLNKKLATPHAKRTREKILAAVDRRLRRDNLVEAFAVTVEKHKVDGRRRYQACVELDATEWARRRRYDGFSVLVGHPELTQTATELCHLYRAKDVVEKDFQVIKSCVKLRPIRHRTNDKVRAHVTLCMLALLLERTLRDQLEGKHTVGQALELLEPCRLNRYRSEGATLYAITQLDKQQRSVLRKLRLQHLADNDHLATRIMPH